MRVASTPSLLLERAGPPTSRAAVIVVETELLPSQLPGNLVPG